MDIRDIATYSGYGVGTVSRVINGQPNVSERARKRILEVMAEHGYEPNSNARYLKMRSQTPVAVFVTGVGNRLFDDVIGPLQAELAREDEEIVVTYLEDGSNVVRAAAEYQHARHPKGMVFLGGELGCFRESFQEIEVPAVLVTSSAEELAPPQPLERHHRQRVRRPRRGGTPLRDGATAALASWEAPSTAGRSAAFACAAPRTALRAHGIELDYGRDFEPCDFLESGGFEAAGRLLDRTPDLTAIFALGDVVAFGALRAICDRGLSVPGDVSLVGFDDTAFSQYSVPRITTIRPERRAPGAARGARHPERHAGARGSGTRARALRARRARERGAPSDAAPAGTEGPPGAANRPRAEQQSARQELARHEPSRERNARMRSSGVLMPVTSLPSPWGVGTMGKEARLFVDFLVRAGVSVWQVLPIVPTSYGDSPYQSFSTYAGNPVPDRPRRPRRRGPARPRGLRGYRLGRRPGARGLRQALPRAL